MSLINWTIVVSIVTAWVMCCVIDFISDVIARVIGRLTDVVQRKPDGPRPM
jgi:small neutral amino acid transporter SnatA (MarC family)